MAGTHKKSQQLTSGAIVGQGGLCASRRHLLFGAATGAIFALSGGAAGAALHHHAGRGAAVLSFHRDEPWVDMTGLSYPYRRPEGLRGGAPLSALSDEQLRCLNCYL